MTLQISRYVFIYWPDSDSDRDLNGPHEIFQDPYICIPIIWIWNNLTWEGRLRPWSFLWPSKEVTGPVLFRYNGYEEGILKKEVYMIMFLVMLERTPFMYIRLGAVHMLLLLDGRVRIFNITCHFSFWLDPVLLKSVKTKAEVMAALLPSLNAPIWKILPWKIVFLSIPCLANSLLWRS